MKVINLLNMKGGVAKTFSVVNMAYELWRRGYKVLLWDNDKQGNLSRAYKRYDAESIAPVSKILGEEWNNPKELIQNTDYDGIDIITANMSLFGVVCLLMGDSNQDVIQRYQRFLMDGQENDEEISVYAKYANSARTA